MKINSNVSDKWTNTNDSIYGMYPTDLTKEASSENQGLVQGRKVGRVLRG